MCVIATGFKKDFESKWFEACCKHNPDGFFVSRVNRGQNLRTLDINAAIDFFEESHPNDLIVLHARIKSVGPVNADNIHGWQSHGVQFCHNGTLSIKARGTLTDSETFFRDIFLPIYQATNRRLTKPVISAINAIIGTSRFLIIRKKAVHRFGNFTKKGGCYFSNMFWDTTTSYYKPKSGTSRSHKDNYAGWWRDNYDAWDDYDDPYYTSIPSTPKTKTKPFSTPVLANLYPLTATTKIYEVLNKVSGYVDSGVLPAVTQLVIGLDITNSLDTIAFSINPLKMASFPYRVFAYMLYFLEDWEGKTESLKTLCEKVEGNPTLTSGVLYNFISSEVHSKIGATFRTASYSHLNSVLKAEQEEIAALRTEPRSNCRASEKCTSWVKMSARIFLAVVGRYLTYQGVSSFVRSIDELLDTDDHGCALYIVYQTLREIGEYLQDHDLESLGKLTSEVINGLYSGTYVPAKTPHGTLSDFWGVLAYEIINRPVPTPPVVIKDIFDARDSVLEAFDFDVSNYPAVGPAMYEAVMNNIKTKPGETA
jgi:hypothetical protein